MNARLAAAVAAALLGGCAWVGVGISVPIGGAGGVGVTIGSDGRVGGSVGVGRGGVGVSVGGSARLPTAAEPAASAASSAR